MNIVGDVVMGIIRHSITTIAGGYVAQGLITGDQEKTMISGLMVAVGLGFSIYDKMKRANP